MNKMQDRWSNLSMDQKSELMDIFLGSGITSLDAMRRAYNEYSDGGSIHIAPSKKGTFTAAATKHGMGVQEFASKVLAHPENYSPAMRKKANFARNASKWHGLGGNLYDDGGLTDQQMNNSYTYYKPLENIFVDSEGNLRDPEVPRARGTIQLPEVTVSMRDPRKYVSAFEGHQDWLRPMADFVPFVGDALQAKDAAVDAVNGDYLNAGIGAGLLLLPNAIEKPLKYIGKGIKRLWKATDSKLDDIYRLSPEQWTPEQWTAAQDAAIARGDMVEAQRLRDLHFKVSAPNTKVKEAVFNGSLSDKPFYEFNTNFRDAYWGGRNDYTTGAWFGTGDENTLLSFAGDNPNRLKKFYLNFSNPFIKDAGYRRWDKLLPFNMTEEDIAIEAAKLREKGFPEYVIEDWKNGLKTTTDNYALKLETTDYDSGIIKNVYENKAHPDSEYGVITDYIASKPNQIKSADAVTYDDNGVRIPLGKRDNFKINDIRYGLLPFLGLGAAGTLYGK